MTPLGQQATCGKSSKQSRRTTTFLLAHPDTASMAGFRQTWSAPQVSQAQSQVSSLRRPTTWAKKRRTCLNSSAVIQMSSVPAVIPRGAYNYRLPRHTRSNGQRYSSRDYILETINTRQYPLTLSQASLATKILFNTSGGNPKAIGVEYLVGKSLYQADARYSANGPQGEKRTATARREVILSGGTFNSPQLLKLGGIGPADELRKFNISVLVDSPGVGANMQANQEMPIVGTLRANSGGLGTGGCVMYKTSHIPFNERDMFIMQASSRAARRTWVP